MYWVEKDFDFEAAHRLLPPYRGKCENLHGHSYQVSLRLGSTRLNPVGFVVDFQELKILGNWIEEHFDHAVLIHHKDHSLREYLEVTKQRFYIFPENPSSEVIGFEIVKKAKEFFPDFKVELTIRETIRSRAMIRDHD